MSALNTLDTLITIFIYVFIFWFLSNVYFFIVFVFNCFGMRGILFDMQFFGSDVCGYIHRFLIALANLFIGFMLSLLGWIFILWMIIIIFVPFIIIVPIPFIPFFIPIPLKFMMLYFIPPFKLLTERGILPLFLRIVLIFFSADSIKNKFQNSFKATFALFYDDIKKVLGEVFAEPTTRIAKNDNDINQLPTVDDGTDNKRKSEKVIEEDKANKNKEAMDLIDEELQLCLKSKQTFNTPDTKNSVVNSASDMNNYSECYAISIKSYLDNKL